MARRQAPERGEIVSCQWPAMVISPAAYNRKAGLALCCPITSHVKGYPFEVRLPEDCEVAGAVLADQVKSLDWRARKARRICTAPQDVTLEVLAKLSALLA